MFLPHFGAAFAGKAVARRPNLGWLIAACQLPDLLWPVFVLAGWERLALDPGNTAYTPLDFQHYPWSHSLLMVVVWGLALAALYFLRARDRRGAVVIDAVVVSHWVLDWISHGPDMPLVPWSDARYGLGLWNSVPATLVVELGLFALAVYAYLRVTSARDRIGSVGLWTVVALLLVSMLGAAFGPPPPGSRTVAMSALLIWLFVPLTAWIDRHRTPGESVDFPSTPPTGVMMRRSILMLAVLAMPALAQQQAALPPNAGVAAAKAVFMVPAGFVRRALEQTPDSLLAFRPTPEIRSLGELFAHVADGEHLFCSLALGEPMMDAGIETAFKSGTGTPAQKKAAIAEAYRASMAHCDKAYAQQDAGVQAMSSFFGNNVSRMWLLGMNGAHDYEHYGNIVTYMRLKGMVPPSSQR